MLEVYKNKKIFITGHTGFKGSWLTLWLQLLGATVKGYALEPDTNPNHFSLLDLKAESEINDINDYDCLEQSIVNFQPDIIFHLAAQPLVKRSYSNPRYNFSTNVMGTVNVLEAARKCPKNKAVIVVTTDKVYENTERDRAYAEIDPLGGYDPYSASKAAAEIVTQSYIRSYFNPSNFNKTHETLVASARAGNVIGGADWADDRLIPDIVRAWLNQSTLCIRYPDSIRPWQYILDCLYGYLLLGEKLLQGNKGYSGSWNFGPTAESVITVRQLLEISQQYTGALNVKEETPLQHEASTLMLDSTKASTLLEWKPIYDGKIMFDKTFEWYDKFYRDNIVLSEKQVHEYMQLL